MVSLTVTVATSAFQHGFPPLGNGSAPTAMQRPASRFYETGCQSRDLLPDREPATITSIMTDEIARAAQIDRLTPKQREVLAYVSEGLTSKEIARKLGVSESAVNQRIETIRQRLGGLSRSHIGRIYRRQHTVLVTLPTSNSLTGKPIQLQVGGEADQTSSAEGAVVLKDPGFEQTDGVLQPSTFSPSLASPQGTLPRFALIIAIALGSVSLLVLLLDAAEKLGRLLE